MTIDVPSLEEWSPELADDQLTHKLAADEKNAEAKVQRLLSLQSTDNTRQARAAIIAEGGTPEAPITSQQLSEQVTLLGDIRLATKIHSEKRQGVRQREGQRLCHELKPAYDAIARRQHCLIFTRPKPKSSRLKVS